MPKRKFDVWDIIIWIALLILIGYILAKLLGIINTPEWVNLIPLITLVFIIGAFYQKVINFMDSMYHRTDYLKKSTDFLSNKVMDHERRFLNLESK